MCNDQIDVNNTNIKITDNNLEMVRVYKYLGVFIDTQLNFQHHNKKLTRNINFKVTHFKRIRRFITTKATVLIYKYTILPVLEYADFIVDQGIASQNKALQKVQNLCLLIINNQHFFKFNERDSTESLHRNAKMFRLVHRRCMHLFQFAFTFRTCSEIVDNRNIIAWRRGGVVFKVIHSNHYKFYKKIQCINVLLNGINWKYEFH